MVQYDCGFSKENKFFRYRSAGIVIHDDKLLFVKCKNANFYYMIGGGVHIGESSEACVKREVFEEAGLNVFVDHLAVICENFFKAVGGQIDGFDCHTIEFYYYINVSDEEMNMCKNITDDGEELVWLSIEDIENSNIKPVCIKENIKEILNNNKIIHFIEEIDK